MFEELVSKVNVGSKLRVSKGTLNLCLEVEKVVDIGEAAAGNTLYKAIELTLTGDNKVSIYEDTDVLKVRRPSETLAKFEWCYRVVDEYDSIFYIADK